MPKIDLDAARAARREATPTDTPTVHFGGRDFALPAELPFGVFVSLASMREHPEEGPSLVLDLIGALFGESADDFIALGPSMADVEVLVEAALAEYGVSPGESSASDES